MAKKRKPSQAKAQAKGTGAKAVQPPSHEPKDVADPTSREALIARSVPSILHRRSS